MSRGILVLAVVVVVLFPFGARAGGEGSTIISYEGRDGVISFTDDPNRIPISLADSAREVNFGSFLEHDRLTPVDKKAAVDRNHKLRERLERFTVAQETSASKSSEEDCGPIQVTSERRSVKNGVGGNGTFSRRFFIASDDCGVLFDAPYFPELNAISR